MSGFDGRTVRPGALLAGIYLPTMLFEIGVGAMLPMIAVSTVRLGGSLAEAAVVVALLGVGRIVADVPAGALAAKVGDRPAMVGASTLAVGALAMLAFAPSLPVLAVGVALMGACDAVYGLARQSYVTAVIHPLHRARALSTVGGVSRIGLFIGPFLGALVVSEGEPARAYLVGVVTSLVAALVVMVIPDPAKGYLEATKAPGSGSGLRQVLREHSHVFATLGLAALGVSIIRGARSIVLPLWTESLGFDPATTSLVFGISQAADMLLFYPGGKVMDRFGRKWVAIPSVGLMGLTMVALPFMSTLAGVAVVAVVLGFANGLGSGLLMTLGADASPSVNRSQFLGIWRLFTDAGTAAGPLLVSGGAALGSLPLGIAAMGLFSVPVIVALARWVPSWSAPPPDPLR